MDRNFSEKELNELIKDCFDTHTNLLKYYCKENMECRYSIKRHIKAVEKHNIVPEDYWHGNAEEFEWLLTLLSDGYPSVDELLRLAQRETKDEIQKIAAHFYQYVDAMFNCVKTYAGYVALQPTEFMLAFYPDAKDKIYVYTSDYLHNGGRSHINKAFLIIPSDRLDDLAALVKDKIAHI